MFARIKLKPLLRVSVRGMCNVIEEKVRRVRNVSIVAHVDAGKTTFTERALYYGGLTKRVGSVDQGTTVTDSDEMERMRGITINASSVTINWNEKYKINLIDTPGHGDFSMGVDQSLCVVDGLIVIIDAAKGVEPQTDSVWVKSNTRQLPRLIFVNKCDRDGKLTEKLIEDMKKRLTNFGKLTMIQYPVIITKLESLKKETRQFFLVDLVKMEVISDKKEKYIDGMFNEKISKNIENARKYLIDVLSENSEKIINEFLNLSIKCEREALFFISKESIIDSLKENIQNGNVCPVMFGSALKGIGVKEILNNIIDYLPCPLNAKSVNLQIEDKILTSKSLSLNELCAFIFKALFKQNSMFYFVKIYSGCLKTKDTILNSNTNTQVQINNLYHVYADAYLDTNVLYMGDIGVIGFVKNINVYDTLINVSSRYIKVITNTPQVGLFCMSCKPTNSTTKLDLTSVLNILTIEDPSFSYYYPFNSPNTAILKGLGPLHLQYLEHKIKKSHNVSCKFGPVSIAYLSTPSLFLNDDCPTFSLSYTLNKNILNKQFSALVSLSVSKFTNIKPFPKFHLNIFDIPNSNPSFGNLISACPSLNPSYVNAATSGLLSSLSSHSFSRYPLALLHIDITHISTPSISSNSLSSIRMAASACLDSLILKYYYSNFSLLWPVSLIHIYVPLPFLSSVQSNLSSKLGVYIISEELLYDSSTPNSTETFLIKAIMPFTISSTYSETLRSLCSGRGSIFSEYLGYTTTPS